MGNFNEQLTESDIALRDLPLSTLPGQIPAQDAKHLASWVGEHW